MELSGDEEIEAGEQMNREIRSSETVDCIEEIKSERPTTSLPGSSTSSSTTEAPICSSLPTDFDSVTKQGKSSPLERIAGRLLHWPNLLPALMSEIPAQKQDDHKQKNGGDGDNDYNGATTTMSISRKRKSLMAFSVSKLVDEFDEEEGAEDRDAKVRKMN